MGKPAARLTDMHACPMVTALVPHVGGPITIGSPNVLTGSLPQARVTDILTCVGPPDAIALGSTGVFVNGLPAARMGDLTAHGGVVAAGLPTVLIGETGGGGPTGAGASATVFPSVASGRLMGGGMSARGETEETPRDAGVALAKADIQAAALTTAAAAGAPFCRTCFG